LEDDEKSFEMKRIGILVSEQIKAKWEQFVEENKEQFSTVSKLIRKAVNFYIDSRDKIDYLNNFSKLSHDLKEPLTAIKGFSQILIDNYSTKLDSEVYLRIKEIYERSNFLESKINDFIKEIEPEDRPYDILIIEDDKSTLMVLSDFFELKGYHCKGITNGSKGLEELKRNKPKLVLLDIILPDIIGYDICSEIKNNKNTHNIPVYYITAIPESEVKSKLKETKADGFLLKPFNFSEFKVLFEKLK